VLAVDALDTLAVGDDLLDSLLERAASLFACNVSDVAPQAEFHWLFLDNRPALRLLAQRLYRMEEEFGFSDDYIAAAAQLLALNPHDNHGIRESLCMAFVESEAWDRVLALSDRYPDDLASLYLNRLLALLRLGRTDEAFALLRARGTHYRLAIEMLLPRKKAVPRAAYSDFGVTQEGLAYNYREHARPLWEHDGALDWLRKAWREVR